jgi:radical SAM superfamily enzyme YgiQ (UPF0313 family)
MTKAKDTRTEEQKESLINLIADIRKKYPILSVSTDITNTLQKLVQALTYLKRVINARKRPLRVVRGKYLL